MAAMAAMTAAPIIAENPMMASCMGIIALIIPMIPLCIICCCCSCILHWSGCFNLPWETFTVGGSNKYNNNKEKIK